MSVQVLSLQPRAEKHAINTLLVLTALSDGAIKALAAGMARADFLEAAAEAFDHTATTFNEVVAELTAEDNKGEQDEKASSKEGSNG